MSYMVELFLKNREDFILCCVIWGVFVCYFKILIFFVVVVVIGVGIDFRNFFFILVY